MAATVLAVVLAVVLAGCGGGDTAEPAASPSRSLSGEESAYLADLGEIREGWADERSLNRGRNVCQKVAAGTQEADLLAYVMAAFEGGSTPDVTREEARRIVAVTERDLCPS